MNPQSTILEGEYVHYKGGRYFVIATATDATNTEADRRVVVYRSLSDSAVYVRDAEEFSEPVVWPDGVLRPRFLKDAIK
jgi:hypothetical protein